MNLKQLLTAGFILFFAATAFGQNKNPFEAIGKQGKILTLTKGSYDELFDNDSIQQIGSALINVRTMKVVKLLTEEESKQRLEGEKHSRFLSVDPISAKYPMLTPYQFASNTPIQAIDLDGLEAFFVHGTESNNTRWFVQDGVARESYTLMNGLLSLTRNKMGDATFNWTRAITKRFDRFGEEKKHRLNYIFNDKTDRMIAAQDLVNHVMEVRKVHGIDKYDDKGNMTEMGSEPITLIGHSHGGNVAIQAANMIYDRFGVQSDIITVATPAYTGVDDIENPANARGVRKVLTIWNNTDGVSGGMAGSDYYPVGPNSKVTRIEVDASKFYKGVTKGTGAHSFDNNHMEEFMKQVNAQPAANTLKEEKKD